MKPHEETWRWDGDLKQIVAVDGGACDGDRVIVETDSGVYPPTPEERALIVAAPAMARVLLEMSCRWDSEWAVWECVCCGKNGGSYRDDGIAPSPEPFEHHETCALDAALRNAGLR